ncbi:MAG: DUF6036 family nucleotidyltransferase [Polyangiaceae bacterium]
MVDPQAVPRIVLDAARLVRAGEIVVFGSASLAFWLRHAPTSRDVDIWVMPAERGEAVEALMGELSWYHERHGAYVEVLGSETFSAPASWRTRAKLVTLPEAPDVSIVVPHPHDVLVAKLERYEHQDRDHVRRILAEMPLEAAVLEALANEAPCRTEATLDANVKAAFETNLAEVRTRLSGG